MVSQGVPCRCQVPDDEPGFAAVGLGWPVRAGLRRVGQRHGHHDRHLRTTPISDLVVPSEPGLLAAIPAARQWMLAQMRGQLMASHGAGSRS